MLVDQPVFLILETTEPGGEGDIVRLAAERDEPAAAATEPPAPPRRLERLARPGRRLTLAQQRALKLTNRELEAAPELDEVLEALLGFCAGAGVCVVAEGEAARRALALATAVAGLARGFPVAVIGVDELGAVVKPAVCRGGLGDLAADYGLDASAAAPGLLRDLWQRLERDLLALPLPLLAEFNWLLNKTAHPLQPVLKAAEGHAVQAQFAAAFTEKRLQYSDLFADFSEVLNALPTREEAEEGAAPDANPPDPPLTAADTTALLGPDSPLARALPAYEHRQEQLELAGRIAGALNDGRHLIAEAGTGVGKSLAYLVPAILFAQRTGRPAMLSTHTKNLQAQLFFKDIPLVRDALKLDFRAALLKGRPNYLCPHKLVYTLQEASHELLDEERAALLPLLTWAVQTKTGDISEVAAFSIEQNYELWDRLHTVGEDCLGRQCPRFRNCFVYRARALARMADLVVLNHALVFAELNLESVLPPYQEIVFDEAHTLEDVATGHLACEVTPRRVGRILNRLFRTAQGSSAGKGLVPSFLFQLEQGRAGLPKALHQTAQAHALAAMQTVEPARSAMEGYFAGLRDWFQQGRGGEDEAIAPHVFRERAGPAAPPAPESYDPGFGEAARARAARAGRPPRRAQDDVRRFSAKEWRPEEADLFRTTKESLVAALGQLRQALAVLVKDFKDLNKHSLPRGRELHRELAAQDTFVQELIGDLEFVMKADEPNHVYWMERLGRRALRVVAAPLDLSGILHDQLLARKRSIILTSATLSVRDALADPGAGLSPVTPARLPARPRAPAPPPVDDLSYNQDAESTPAAATARVAPPRPASAPASEGRPHPKSFEFLKQRLGLALCEAGKVDEVLEGSPFDYTRQCRFYVPVCLPDPAARAERDFSQELSALIAKLAAASGGRALALYTSHEALRAGAAALRKPLAAEGVEVLAQGQDGSREALLAKLKAGGRTLLLGTASFWEGIDVPGQALSLLIIAKLPFAVFTDPLVEGRCELLERQGKDPFLHFSVPVAILKLRQGFGRLIRTKTDRGAVVLCDKRVLTKRYGPAFLRALPIAPRKATDPDALAEEIREFLDAPRGAGE